MMTPIHDDPPGDERRHAPRARFSGITIVRTGQSELPCIAGDVSEGGMLLYPQRPAPVPGTDSVKVVFTLPNLARWIEVEAQVVRAHERRRRRSWALSFRRLADRDRRLVQAYVAENQRSQAARDPEAPTPPEVAIATPQETPTLEDMMAADERVAPAHEAPWHDDSRTTQVFRRELS
ncbi:MAG: PilZ domain-containing protein [Myxococcales bacterium]|nr:PilZ domain-containing protein [Myxococcales bacterium]